MRAIPKRLARIAIHSWNGIKGTTKWLFTGLKGIAKAGWEALTGVFGWLKNGLTGALDWLQQGLKDGAQWAIDFIQNPSLNKLKEGFFGALNWLGNGVKGFAKWGWRGIVAAAKWAKEGVIGLGKWLKDGLIGGAKWVGTMLMYLLDIGGTPEILQTLVETIWETRPLTATEIAASQRVHKAGLIPYHLVRVFENSWMAKIVDTAFVSFHMIHDPNNMLSDPSTAVHELTHVAQYEAVGSLYMPQALSNQNQGYNYGNLTLARKNKRHFSDFHREAQAEICGDYYNLLINPSFKSSSGSGSLTDYQHYINQMNNDGF